MVKYTPLERSSLLICEPVVFFAIYSSSKLIWAVVHYYIVHIFPGALSFYELKEGRLHALVRLVFSKTDAVCTYTGRVGSAFEGVKNNDGRNNLSMFPNDPRPQMIPKIDRKWSSTVNDHNCRPQMIPWKAGEWNGMDLRHWWWMVLRTWTAQKKWMKR